MVEVKKYHLPPTALVPNSPHPLLHYPGLLSPTDKPDDDASIATRAHDLFARHGWETQWIFRYGPSQRSHYHSGVHECMAVLTGTATIRFGVADTVADLDESTHGAGREEGGVEVTARAGDVFVLPAGTAHKTFNAAPVAEFKLLTPGDGHAVPPAGGEGGGSSVRDTLAGVELAGFTMIGAYPKGGGRWDFAQGGEDVGNFEKVWAVAKPENDPVLGKAEEGLCGQWR
ncbi:Cupin domain-containing protein [Cladophialophora immunda]|nr:Cupin domain-containing protein [Cladophialophora immunda]